MRDAVGNICRVTVSQILLSTNSCAHTRQTTLLFHSTPSHRLSLSIYLFCANVRSTWHSSLRGRWLNFATTYTVHFTHSFGWTKTKTNKLLFAWTLLSDGALCVGIGAHIAEYVLRTESSEAIVWPIAAKCWQYGRHPRLSGKLKHYIFARMEIHQKETNAIN